MAIKKATELDFSNKKIAMLLTGRPGVGKTTLALSAPNPLLVDLENGVSRVEACYRKDTSTVDASKEASEVYNEFVEDIKNANGYDTIIVDTLGKLIDIFTPIVIKENTVNAQKDGKTLSLKGYGAISAKINEFTKLVESLNKHVIYIAHVTETQDGDVVKTRVNISGSTKDKIWDNIDLGGYVTFLGKERVICFTPTEQYDAKGTNGISGNYKIPELKSTEQGGNNKDNRFLSDLFEVFTNKLNSDNNAYKEGLEKYKKAMEFTSVIQSCATIDDLNDVCEKLKGVEHALTSKQELLSYVSTKANELGATYDKETRKYIAIKQD